VREGKKIWQKFIDMQILNEKIAVIFVHKRIICIY